MSFVIHLFWSKYPLISLSLFYVCISSLVFIYSYTDARKEPPVSRHNRWQDSNLSSGSKVRFDLKGHPSTGPAKMWWRRSLLQYSLPRESPCVSTAKQLRAEDAEPFTSLWQYCNTWKQQPCSQVMKTNWVESFTNLESTPNTRHTFTGSGYQNVWEASLISHLKSQVFIVSSI